jgi:hypothetical protein
LNASLSRSRFLQGPGTDPATVAQIRDAIKNEQEMTVRILNYTKSGRPFWNMFTLAPMSGVQQCDGGGGGGAGTQVSAHAGTVVWQCGGSAVIAPV